MAINTPVVLLIAIVLVAFFTFTNFSRDGGNVASHAAAAGAADEKSAEASPSSFSTSTTRKKQQQQQERRQEEPAVATVAANAAVEIPPAPVLDAVKLFGAANAVERTREDACTTVNDEDNNKEQDPAYAPAVIHSGAEKKRPAEHEDDDENGAAAVNKKSSSSSLFELPTCPAHFKLFTNDSTDAESIDRRTNWVISKYKLYARRCRVRNGIMWAKLTHTNFYEIVQKVAKVVAPPSAASPSKRSEPFVMHDWGCGCGVGMDFFSKMFQRLGSHSQAIGNREFYGLGLDLIAEAVMYAQQSESMKALQDSGHVRFCHADGTDLSFLPSRSFDAVVAFGALLHVPKRSTCSTVAQMLRILKPGGILWAGYIDDMLSVQLLSECSFVCGGGGGGMRVEVTVVREDLWFKGLMPKSNTRRKPRSIIWRKL